ncbi:MAG TPA: membrane protein insertase YidC, partial [Gemmatimonadales bacterium]|nr:membrane protein insertase YidC [Gemmatimonadales bacterium]
MDRRFIWAMALMTLIVMAPAVFMKKPPAPVVAPVDSTQLSAPVPAPLPVAVPAPVSADGGTLAAVPEDTILIHTPLSTYGISTRGARLVTATLEKYESQVSGHTNQRVELMLPGSELMGLRVVVGADTLRLDDWQFTASTGDRSIDGPTPVEFTATQGNVAVRLVYTFRPDDYQVGVEGSVTGVGPNGGLLLVGMGPGLANTEANLVENERSMGFVTKAQSTKFKSFQSLDTAQVATVSGPFEWVAVKSKYFVTALLAFEPGAQPVGGLAVRPLPQPGQKKADRAGIWASMLLPVEGGFRYTVYAGPMEYSRLAKVGHDFDDVNPYGWPGFRTIIRPVAVAVRWLLVWMHDNLHLAYGMVLVLFGILVRLVLWPLNQKAMRSTMAMQAIQPELKAIQDKYKEDPQRLQQEMFKLYKEHNVNPLGGCWPMLLPMPVLLALFFVFQNTIELRGQAFLWLPDLSRPDPLYIIPLIMGLSMFWLTRMGQRGIPPNPQMKMMMYVMPIMMTVLFLNFASGLNLYYAVSNLASVPQQW